MELKIIRLHTLLLCFRWKLFLGHLIPFLSSENKMSGIYKGVGNQLIFTDSLRRIRSNNVKILALLLYFKRKNAVRVYLLFDSWIIQATCKLTIMIKKIWSTWSTLGVVTGLSAHPRLLNTTTRHPLLLALISICLTYVSSLPPVRPGCKGTELTLG